MVSKKATDRAKAIRRARQATAELLLHNVYITDNREDWIPDILCSIRDYIGSEICAWDEMLDEQ